MSIPPPPGAGAPPSPGPPGSAPGSRRPMVAGAVVLAVLLVALAVTAGLVLRDRAGASLPYGDREVVDGEAALLEGEVLMRQQVTERGGRLQEPAHCWFVYIDPPEDEDIPAELRAELTAAPVSVLACGPVLFPGGDPAKPWIEVPVDFQAGPDGYVPHVDRSKLDRFEDSPLEDIELRRPDGEERPERITISVP